MDTVRPNAGQTCGFALLHRWPDDLADEEITARLLALNLQRAKGE
jgi:hypothetical protein